MRILKNISKLAVVLALVVMGAEIVGRTYYIGWAFRYSSRGQIGLASRYSWWGSSPGGITITTQNYIKDVRDLTAMHVEKGFNETALVKDVISLAKANGMSDFRTEETLVGIGAGLKKAGLSAQQFEAFIKGAEASNAEMLKAGYAQL